MTTRQRIDSMRETRLWVTGVGVPLLAILAANPEARQNIGDFGKRVYNSGKNAVTKIWKKVFK